MSAAQAGDGALHGKEATDYLMTEVQTDRDNETYKDWNLERTRWTEEKLALQAGAEALRGEKERALADIDFFRVQYQRASDFASSTRSENEELSARAALAESQATKGVALVRATFEGRVTKLEAEVQKYKALSEVLTERARRTDDEVRYRAALVPEFERNFRQFEGRFNELEAELEETKDELFDEKRANAKLRRQVARLEQAADVGQSTEQHQDYTFWSDEKDDGDYNPPRSPSSSPRGDSDRSSIQSQRQEDHSPRNEDDARLEDGEIEELDSFGLGESAQSSNDAMVYLCRWIPGESTGNCDAVVNTKEVNPTALTFAMTCR
jgi:phage regulator Rha-like protein